MNAMTSALVFSDVSVSALTSYDYAVLAYDENGNASALSPAVEVTTLSDQDLQAPLLVSAMGSQTSVVVVFNEDLEVGSAETLAHYSTTAAVVITSATLAGDNRTVVLETSGHVAGDYVLSVSGVEDVAGNAMALEDIAYSYAPFSGDGLLGYWDFDEGSGTVLSDLSGNGNTGTLMNGPVWTLGGELSFDGIDDYVDLGSRDLGLSNDLSVAMWVYVASDTGSRQAILQKGTYITPFRIRYDRGAFRVGVRSDGVTYLNSNADVVIGEWVHLVVTYTDGALSIYVDGELDATAVATGSLGGDDDAFTLGSTPTGADWFSGSIDDLLVFGRAVSAEEVASLHEGARPE